MKSFLLCLAGFLLLGQSYHLKAQQNFTFLGKRTYTQDLSDVWGWVHPNGSEYALVGVYNGVSIVNVTNPANPVQTHFITGANTFWRDIKTWGNYAYVTNEGGGGLLIINLSNLPNSITTSTWTGGTGLSTAHNIFIDENGVAYIVGHNIGNGGALMVNVNANPTNPPILGNYNSGYVHDVFVRNDTMWTAEINNGYFAVVNVTNKANPVIMATQNTPGNFTHNLWLSNDGKTLVTTDEVSGGYITTYDVSNLNNITELRRIRTASNNVIPHNAFFINNFIIVAYYRDGIVLYDATQPDNLIQVGNYDTSPLSGNGFNGAWGVYPYLPSGNVLAADIEEGLFVLSPNYQQAAYLRGNVTNASTGQALNTVSVSIQSINLSATTNISGNYRTGTTNFGTYDVTFSRTGFVTQTISNVSLQSGVSVVLDVQMVPAVNVNLTGQVFDTTTLAGVPNAFLRFVNATNDVTVSTNSMGGWSVNSLPSGSYEVYVGKWGYTTIQRFRTYMSTSGNHTFYLSPGYDDHFLFDFGWTVQNTATTGAWERGVPIGTSLNGVPANPGNDVPNDFGQECYITGNGGGTAGFDDIDNGWTELTSPPMNLTGYANPYISFYRWFYAGGGNGNPDDTMRIRLTNGQDTVLLEQIIHTSPGNSNWVFRNYRALDYLPLTANMRLLFYASDLPGNGHVVEAGVDYLVVVDSPVVDIPTANFTQSSTQLCAGGSVTFFDQSSGPVTGLLWLFPGGTPVTSTATQPQVFYNTPGSYSVTLIAQNGNQADTLTQPNLITVFSNPLVLLQATGETCQGCQNGTITSNILQGAGPFTFNWSNGATTANLSGLAPGIYSLTVTDNNGCQNSATTQVNAWACPVPTGIGTQNILKDGVRINWIAISGAAGYEVQIRPSGTAAWYQQLTTNNFVRFSCLLNPSTTYEYQVRTWCSANLQGAWSVSHFFTTLSELNYCVPSTASAGLYIKEFCVATSCKQSGNSGLGYEDFSCISGRVNAGATYPLKLTAQSGSSLSGAFWYLFIDLNRDGDFDDPGELVYTSGQITTPITSGNFSIPNFACPGPTRLRVRLSSTQTGSCTANALGQTEDYTLIIVGGSGCSRQEMADQSDFKIHLFPNPAEEKITLLTPKNHFERYLIFSADGREVLQGNVVESGKTTVSVNHLPAGLFFLRLISSEKQETLKFFKQ